MYGIFSVIMVTMVIISNIFIDTKNQRENKKEKKYIFENPPNWEKLEKPSNKHILSFSHSLCDVVVLVAFLIVLIVRFTLNNDYMVDIDRHIFHFGTSIEAIKLTIERLVWSRLVFQRI